MTVFKRCCAAALAIVVVVHSANASSSRERKAEKIVRKHVIAMGGSSAIHGLKAMHVSGRIEQQGFEFAFELFMKRPNLSRMNFTLQGRDVVQAYDGKTAWWINPFSGAPSPQVMPASLAKSVVRWSDFDGPLIDYKKKRTIVEYFGEEDSELGRVLKMRVTRRDGEVWNVYLDAESYLEIKRTFVESTGGRAREVVTYFEEYEEVMGVMLPSVIQGEGLQGQRYTMYFDSFKPNPDIDDGKFRMNSADTR